MSKIINTNSIHTKEPKKKFQKSKIIKIQKKEFKKYINIKIKSLKTYYYLKKSLLFKIQVHLLVEFQIELICHQPIISFQNHHLLQIKICFNQQVKRLRNRQRNFSNKLILRLNIKFLKIMKILPKNNKHLQGG